MEIVINFSRICIQSLVPKVRFCRSEFGLSGLKITDFGRNGQDLILILVKFLYLISEIFPLLLNVVNCVIFYKQNDAFQVLCLNLSSKGKTRSFILILVTGAQRIKRSSERARKLEVGAK